MSIKRFNKEFEASIEKTAKAIDKTIRTAALELFADIVVSTPVGNPSLWKNDAPSGYRAGSLRGNWQVTFSSPAVSDINNTDENGTSTIKAGKGVISRYEAEDNKALYFTNNLPYAQAVEDGWSSQRPSGMVKINTIRFGSELSIAVRKNKV